MRKNFRYLYAGLLILWDIFSVHVSVVVGFKLKYGLMAILPAFYVDNMPYFIGVSAVIALLSNLLFGCYNSIWRYASVAEMIRQAAACFATGFVLIAGDRILRLGMPFEAIIIMTLLLLLMMLGGRLSVRFLRHLRAHVAVTAKRGPARRALIYGAGEAGCHLVSRLRAHPEEGMKPIAFADDNEEMCGRKVAGLKILGGSGQLMQLIEDYAIDVVVITFADADSAQIKRIFHACNTVGCAVKTYGNLRDVSRNLDSAGIDDINLELLLRRDRVTLNMDAVKDFVTGRTVLVSGGAGSIGSEICRQVLRYGAKKLIVFDFNENGLFHIGNELQESFGEGRYETILGSVRDISRLEEVFARFEPDIVFHAAAHKHVPMMEISPCEAIKNNVFGTIKLAQTAAKAGVRKFILISTDKAVNPANIMGASKRIAEMVIQMMDEVYDKTDFCAVRFGNVLGSNGSVVPHFKKQIERGGPVTVTHADMRRYFMTIPEAVQLVTEAGAMAKGGEIFVLDMGEPVKIYDLACDMIRLSGFEPERDIKIAITGLRPGEKLFEELRLSGENTEKTSNNKIFIMKPIEKDMFDFARKIKRLEEDIRSRDTSGMFATVRELVPTFEHDDR